jgi:Uri superfamily endonuclease
MRFSMSEERKLPPLTVLGGNTSAGSYVLRIAVCRELALSFGRFKKGEVITLPAGEYAYVGSALGRKGAVSLGRRLVRHATRTGDKAPHPIRETLISFFYLVGLERDDLTPKTGKHLFWNVDHLLDCEEAELTHAILMRSETRLERELGQFLENDPASVVIEKGLGANDVPGNTHLLRIEADEAWWCRLPERLTALLKSPC